MITHQSTEECFEDLCSRFLDFSDRNQFADIFGIKQTTLATWNNHGLKAGGEKMVRIRVGLELLGYNILEWAAFDRSLYSLVEAVAYDVMTVQDITDRLNYASTNQLMSVILKNTSMTKDRHKKALCLIDAIGPEVDKKRARAIESVSKIGLADFYFEVSENQDFTPPLNEHWIDADQIYYDISVQEKILMFDNLVKALMPLARYFDSSLPEDRKVLRKAVGYSEMAEVTELLRGLSSEKYRESR